MPEQSLDIECSHCHNTAHYKVVHDGEDKLDASLEYLKGVKPKFILSHLLQNIRLIKQILVILFIPAQHAIHSVIHMMSELNMMKSWSFNLFINARNVISLLSKQKNLIHPIHVEIMVNNPCSLMKHYIRFPTVIFCQIKNLSDNPKDYY